MSWQVRHHPLVELDILEAYTWYEYQKKDLGERFAKAVQKKLASIQLIPESFGSRSNKTHREVMVDDFPYLIIYRLNKKKKIIFISSIHHTKKHPRHKIRR